MIDISIIMPVYNSEKYLKHAVKSIQNQSNPNFELILVDDGSQDKSGRICDELAEEDSRIRVIHKKNGGMCAARNQAMKIARGKYIGFCDNDDEFLPGLLNDNLYLAKKYDADIIRFSRKMTEIRDGKIVSVRVADKFKSRYIPAEQFADYYEEVNDTGEGVWAGIYKKEFVYTARAEFDEAIRFGYEDTDFLLKLYLNHPTIVLNNKVYYHWIARSNHSTTAKININNIVALKKCLYLKRKLYEDNNMMVQHKYTWLSELSKRICRTYTYVSPKKGEMRWNEKKKFVKCLAECEVFPQKFGFKQMMECVENKKSFDGVILFLFINKHFRTLYNLMCVRIGVVDVIDFLNKK